MGMSCRTCKDLVGKVAENGFYTCDLPGVGPTKLYCDMKNDKGGWTVLWASSRHNRIVDNNEDSVTSDPTKSGQRYNRNYAIKNAVSKLSTESINVRRDRTAWLKVDKDPFRNGELVP